MYSPISLNLKSRMFCSTACVQQEWLTPETNCNVSIYVIRMTFHFQLDHVIFQAWTCGKFLTHSTRLISQLLLFPLLQVDLSSCCKSVVSITRHFTNSHPCIVNKSSDMYLEALFSSQEAHGIPLAFPAF